MNLYNRYSNIEAVIVKLFKCLTINITAQMISDELEKHPDNPSILAISDVLTWFKIPNEAYRIDLEKIVEVSVPFIAHTNKKDFVVVTDVNKETITLSNHALNNHQMPLSEFKNAFNGVVLVAEAPENATELNQRWFEAMSVYKMHLALFVLGLIFISSIFLFNNYLHTTNWLILLLAAIKTCGVIVSILLLIQSIDKNNPLVQTLCGGDGKTNCNAILTSKAAIAFKGLTWSEVGFFYFTGTLLALLFGGNEQGMLFALTLLNVISLPYTIYSINYQARIAKQWCVLCSTVQGFLWLEIIIIASLFSFGQKMIQAPSEYALIILAMCLASPVAIWMVLKPLLLKNQQLATLKGQLQRFKNNKELFDSALKEQPKYAMPDDEWSIILGNVEANTIVTMVSNPYCQPCSKTHVDLENWLDRLDGIQLRIIFTADNTEGDKRTPIVRHIMALNDQVDKVTLRMALHDWYEQKQKTYQEWAKKYPVKLEENKFFKLEKQRAWCEMAGIKVTPTLLINGCRLPEPYRLLDIKYMLG